LCCNLIIPIFPVSYKALAYKKKNIKSVESANILGKWKKPQKTYPYKEIVLGKFWEKFLDFGKNISSRIVFSAFLFYFLFSK
tara:strand:+ start:143 stop:388 length:246 start_codon:yes stop_codon:yes gene_type:complete